MQDYTHYGGLAGNVPPPPAMPGGIGPGGFIDGRPMFPPAIAPARPFIGQQPAAYPVPGGPAAQLAARQKMLAMMGTMLAGIPGMNVPGMPGQEKAVQPAGADLTIPENQTLYINNLNDRIKTDRLKKDLMEMFKNFGTIIDVICMKSFWRRGQAWVIFKNVESATKALKGLQGFPYNNKPMRINYAHSKSDVVSKEDGSFLERPTGVKKPRAIIAREKALQAQLQEMQKLFASQQSTAGPAGAAPPTTKSEIPETKKISTDTAAQAAKQRALEGGIPISASPIIPGFFASTQQPPNRAAIASIHLKPSRILCVEGVPEGTESSLEIMFKRYPGFVSVRLDERRRSTLTIGTVTQTTLVCFVEYDGDDQAGTAMNALQNYTIRDGFQLRISYHQADGR